MPKLFLVSYATDQFQSVRRELNASAIEVGISTTLSYSLDDLHASAFYRENKTILDAVCGAGYWAWKPYFILQAMQQLSEGDILFYCDAGSLFIDSPGPLVDICNSAARGIVLFDTRPLTNRQFTKRDCFVRMDCDQSRYWNANILVAGILVLRKCAPALSFVHEWLTYCCDRAAITDDPNICGKKNLKGFLQHRNDQSILSVLAAKHSLETFRNPTVWGNFLKLPQFRTEGEPVPSPYNLAPSIRGYSDRPLSNSPYGTIFAINRQPNMVGKKPLTVSRSGAHLEARSKVGSWVRSAMEKIRRM